MNELQVIVTQKPAEISFNFNEIKQGLSEQMEIYKSMEVTEDVLVERKKDVATLRKMAKAIDDKRKEVKSGYMIPFDEFEKKAKELIEIINEPIDLINKQVKEFDEKQKAEKKAKALEYFNGNVGDVDIIFEEVFSPSWLLSATSFKSIKSDIDTAVSNRKADIETIEAMESEVEERLWLHIRPQRDWLMLLRLSMNMKRKRKLFSKLMSVADVRKKRKESERKSERLVRNRNVLLGNKENENLLQSENVRQRLSVSEQRKEQWHVMSLRRLDCIKNRKVLSPRRKNGFQFQKDQTKYSFLERKMNFLSLKME